MNVLYQSTRPMNIFISVTMLGRKFNIAETLSGSVLRPSLSNKSPKYFRQVKQNSHFSKFIAKFTCAKR